MAKAWLIAKNRYVPVTKRTNVTTLNLANTQFADINSIRDAIHRHIKDVAGRSDGQAVQLRIHAALTQLGYDNEVSLDRSAFLNTDLMTLIAGFLQLPANLLVLRAREAVLNDDLTTLNGELTALKKELRISVFS